MPPLKDLTGQPFGRLTVIRQATDRHGPARWECLCTCGTIKTIYGQALRKGNTKSCGCLNTELPMARRVTSGLSHTSTYDIFCGMLDRCYNTHNAGFRYYGARGITVEWNSFEQFYEDMGPRPTRQHSIDRIDNNGPYKKDNCAWVLRGLQAQNTRQNVFWTHNRETWCIAEWARRTGINAKTLAKR